MKLFSKFIAGAKAFWQDEDGVFGIDDLLAAGLGSQVLGGILGNVASSGSRDQATAAQQAALAALTGVKAPTDLADPITLAQYMSSGQYDPNLEKDINLGPSAVSQIQENPNTVAAQQQALQQLQQYSQTGMNASDRLAFNNARTQAKGDTVAAQNSILNNLRAQGMGSSGASLGLQLQAAQSAANQESTAADEAAAGASQRALTALGQYGTLAGQQRQQNFDIANQKASAADQFQRFNVQNQLGVQQQNVNSQNQGQQYNLQNAQNISNANVENQNNATYAQRQLEQQQYQDQLGLAQAQAGAYNTNAAQNMTNAANTAGMVSGVGNSIGAGLGSIAQANQTSDFLKALYGQKQNQDGSSNGQ